MVNKYTPPERRTDLKVGSWYFNQKLYESDPTHHRIMFTKIKSINICSTFDKLYTYNGIIFDEIFREDGTHEIKHVNQSNRFYDSFMIEISLEKIKKILLDKKFGL